MFETYPKIKIERVSGEVTGNIPLSSNGNTGKKILIEDVEDVVDEPPDSDFSKIAAILFDQIDNGKAGVLPSSNLAHFIETLGEVFHNE